MGRRKNSRNKGYFYRKGRGWYAKPDGKNFVPLEYPNGDRMRDRDTPESDVKEAYHRLMVIGNAPSSGNGVTVRDACIAYLSKAKGEGAIKTYIDRADTLYDFCYGVPPRFRTNDEEPTADDRIHPGYGTRQVREITGFDVDQWLQSHPTWTTGKRTRVQAVKRAFNYAAESGLLGPGGENPIKGYKIARQKPRTTYITPKQEQALQEHANDAFKVALQVCIRTGARPGCEFAALTARHVTDHGNRMEWTFQPDESKNGRLRVIRITDPEVIELVRERLDQGGPLFRNSQGGVWREKNLSLNFRRTKKRTGLEFDDDACMYSCRHTYAKRVLQGYWSDRPTNIETLARLMGNSPQVCRDHYLQWCESYNEPLWESA